MLSKSRILSGLQCPRRLYLQVHRPELATASSALEHRFDVGHRLNDVARSFHPEGRLIAAEDPGDALVETRQELSTDGDKVLFEAALAVRGLLVRADILSRHGGAYELREVKSTTWVKDCHRPDVAVQAWTLLESGLDLRRTFVTHIDRDFVYAGDGRYQGLLCDEDVSEAAEGLLESVPGWIDSFTRVLEGDEPAMETGSHCNNPFSCPFHEYCSADDPLYPVEILPRSTKVIAQLREAGYRDLRFVPQALLESA